MSKMEQSNETDVNESEKIEEIREWLKNMPEINPKTGNKIIIKFTLIIIYGLFICCHFRNLILILLNFIFRRLSHSSLFKSLQV